jgi:hypothetical protein
MHLLKRTMGRLPRFGGKPPRLKDALSALPTISLCENGDLLHRTTALRKL